MDITLKSIVLLGAILFTGLSAGLFFGWSVSVIPGTKKVMDLTYLESMQSINRGILNPTFFLIFFGCAVLLCLSSMYHFQTQKVAFALLVAATITYVFGAIGVTGLGNVPLNNQLEALQISTLSEEKVTAFRHYYESKWNRLHLIRTVFAVLSFMMAVFALITQLKNN